MKYFLSTIADVDFKVVDGVEQISYVDRTAKLANKWGLGLELAEFCISDNLDKNYDTVLPHFVNNRNSNSLCLMHGPFNELFPHAMDSLVANAAWTRYDWTWQMCRKYGLDKVVLHANYMPSLYYPEWFTVRQIEFWKAFLKEHRENITICLENVMEPVPEFMTDIIKGVDDDRMRMCLDVGHANLTDADPYEWLEKCAPYISHYHIHNNEGPVEGTRPSLGDTHQAPGRGNIDMKKFLNRAETLTPDATAAIESVNIEESVDWLIINGFVKK